ncbi:MAG: PfkB family carbohydrate kinase [Solirubrobacterales bacterium]
MAETSTEDDVRLRPCSVAIFAPSPVLTVTVEAGRTDPEIHLHAGGQGFWVARMAARLGAEVRLCVPVGGETGTVLESLLETGGIKLIATRAGAANGTYLHDRRSGERREIAQVPSPTLQRHELDDLYDATLAAGLRSELTLLTGPQNDDVLPPETYERLTRDLKENGRFVLGDLSGGPLKAALRGGIDMLKASDEELAAFGLRKGSDAPDVVETARELRKQGAANVLISRGDRTAVVLLGDRLLGISGPHFVALDERGAGDSMFAGVGVGLASGLEVEDALRVGVAAGALNVTRHGLGTGDPKEIASIAAQVEIAPLDVGPGDDRPGQDSAAAAAS